MKKLFLSLKEQQINKIIGIGQNYVPVGSKDVPSSPIIFTKPHSSILNPGENLKLQKTRTSVRYEVELGFMFSKTGRNIKQTQWNDYVGGYFLCMDITNAATTTETATKQVFPWNLQWDLAQGEDGFLPVSNFINQSRIPNPDKLRLTLQINNQTVVNDPTSNMYFQIPQLVSYTSEFMTVHPGDLFLSGTPQIGPIKIGDSIQASLLDENEKEIESIKFNIEQEK